MSRWWPFAGRGHDGAGSANDGKRNPRGVSATIMGAGVALALIVAGFVAQAWMPLAARLSSGAPTANPIAARSPATTPTATVAPTPPPIYFANSDLTWPTYMGESQRTGSSGNETTLTAAAVSHLKVQWRLHAGGTIYTQPVVANGLIYWGSWDGYEHATSVATGRDVWARYLGKTTVLDCEGTTVGVSSTATVAFAPVQGRRTPLVFVGGGNGIFYALDASTGAVVWQRSLGQPPATYLWSSPAYYASSIYMGVASLGDCPLVQGKVVKLSAATGGVESVFNVVPNGCVGGTIWGSVAIDPDAGILYVGTGNQGACGVYEPYVDALVALRTSDLGLVGAWQAKEAVDDFIDSDFGSTPTLFTAQINGATRQMVGIVNKNGLFYAFDAAHVGRGPIWTTRISDVAICPECGDGGFVPGVWDGKLLYEPGGKTTINGRFCAGGLRALNPANGKVVWSACFAGPTFAALTLGPGFLVIGATPRLLVVGTEGASAGHTLFTFQDAHAPNVQFFGAPSLANGVLYVGDAAGNLYALRP